MTVDSSPPDNDVGVGNQLGSPTLDSENFNTRAATHEREDPGIAPLGTIGHVTVANLMRMAPDEFLDSTRNPTVALEVAMNAAAREAAMRRAESRRERNRVRNQRVRAQSPAHTPENPQDA